MEGGYGRLAIRKLKGQKRSKRRSISPEFQTDGITSPIVLSFALEISRLFVNKIQFKKKSFFDEILFFDKIVKNVQSEKRETVLDKTDTPCKSYSGLEGDDKSDLEKFYECCKTFLWEKIWPQISCKIATLQQFDPNNKLLLGECDDETTAHQIRFVNLICFSFIIVFLFYLYTLDLKLQGVK